MSTPLSNTSPSGPAIIVREAVPRHGAGAGQEVDARAATLCTATPMELVEAERQGVQGIYLKDLSLMPMMLWLLRSKRRTEKQFRSLKK